VLTSIRTGRTSWLVILLIGLSALVGCRREADTTTRAAPASAMDQASSADFDFRPVLREFLKNLPADWYVISAREAEATRPFVVDVREPAEYAQGFIEGAVNIPIRELAANLRALPDKAAPVMVVCDTGHRGAIGMAVLRMLGYSGTRTLDGGIEGWRKAGLTVVTTPVPQRATGAVPSVDEPLRAALDYYLVHDLPAEQWGVIDGPGLTWDRTLMSSTELYANPDSYEQGRSFLADVDDAVGFAAARRGSNKLAEAFNLPLHELTEVLDRIPMETFVSKS
jgi:rhodanese-related sulfurtransferase